MNEQRGYRLKSERLLVLKTSWREPQLKLKGKSQEYFKRETLILLFSTIFLSLPHYCVCVAEDKNFKMPSCDPLFFQGPLGHWLLRTKGAEIGDDVRVWKA